MSATPRICKKYISNKVGSNNIINYKLNTDYSYIEKLYFYRDERVIEDNLLDNIAKGEKVIYFNHSAIECYRLSEKYNNSMFLCGKDNKLYRYVNKELVENMLQNEKFDTQMLFTTQCMDNGVNIKDRQIKHIVIDIKDFDTLIQCLGRKRVLDENDTVAVYVKNVSKEQLGGDVTGGKNKLAIADELSWITTKQWIMKYPRENTDTGIVYYGKDKELHVNYIAYVKYEDKVKFAEVLLKYANDSKNYVDKKYPYACTVSTNLGRKWKMYDNEHSIKTFEEYLESMVGIRLFKDDGQQQLKEQFEVYGLKVKNDRNMGLNTMNGFLADMELLYEIISKKVKVDGKLLTAWIITDLPN